METNETYYIDLIISYFKGEASEEDIRFLEEWVKSDPANAKQFGEYARTWSHLEHDRIEAETDLDAEWKRFQFVTRRSQPGVRKNFILRIAALILLLAIPAFIAYRYFAPAPAIVLSAGTTTREVTLPDGSTVTLNAGSTLEYPEKFKGGSRNVSLNGEAYFTVTHDENHPFTVSGREVLVKVLGTEFNVNTRAENGKMEVVLTDGSVSLSFRDQTTEPVVLIPGEKGEIPANMSGISKSVNHDPNYMAWKTHHFVFADMPLSRVVATLSSAYHTPIIIRMNHTGNCRITAAFDKQPLESVLNVLKATLNLQIARTGTGYEITGSGCN
jgi:transmembrane sensor